MDSARLRFLSKNPAGLVISTKIEPKRTRPSMKVLPIQQHACDTLNRLGMRERNKNRARSNRRVTFLVGSTIKATIRTNHRRTNTASDTRATEHSINRQRQQSTKKLLMHHANRQRPIGAKAQSRGIARGARSGGVDWARRGPGSGRPD